MTIGERFREVRRLADEPNKKCSQKDFGDMFKIGRDAVANIENGRVEPSEILIENVCNKFGLSYKWLRSGEEPMRMPAGDDEIDFVGQLMDELDNPFVDLIRSVMTVYMELSPDDQRKAMEFAKNLRNQIKKENRG